MAKLLGYKSKAVRGITDIPGIRSITFPLATRDEVDVTDLQSANYEREFLLGFKSRSNAIYEGLYNQGNAVQEAIENDFNSGLSTPEDWGHRICNNDTGAVLRTYDYEGTIFSCNVGPLATEEAIGFTVEIKLAGAIVIS